MPIFPSGAFDVNRVAVASYDAATRKFHMDDKAGEVANEENIAAAAEDELRRSLGLGVGKRFTQIRFGMSGEKITRLCLYAERVVGLQGMILEKPEGVAIGQFECEAETSRGEL